MKSAPHGNDGVLLGQRNDHSPQRAVERTEILFVVPIGLPRWAQHQLPSRALIEGAKGDLFSNRRNSLSPCIISPIHTCCFIKIYLKVLNSE